MKQKPAARIIALFLSLIMAVCCFAVNASAASLYDSLKEQSDIANKQQRSITEVRNADDVTLVAHRGVGTEAPENTLPAYQIAAEKGFQYAETDIQTTKDGVWVVSHDSNLKRMTGYDGEIKDMTLAEVQSHPIINGANADKYPGLVTPTLDDFVRTCRDCNLNPVIEIKVFGNQPYQDILDTLDQYGMTDRAVIISFYTQPLAAIRRLNPDIKEQYLSNTMSQRVVLNAALLQNCGIDVLGYTMLLDPVDAKLANDLGIETNVWTIDDPTLGTLLVLVDNPVYITTNTLMPKQA